MSHLQAFLRQRQNDGKSEERIWNHSPLDTRPAKALLKTIEQGQPSGGCLFVLTRQGEATQCPAPLYKRKLCQGHFFHILKRDVRRAMSLVYKDPASCYASFDFSGKGYVTLEDVVKQPLIKQLSDKYSAGDI